MVVSGGREVCGKLAGKIREVAGSIERDVRLMEVCGTHTQVVARYGIRSVLPSSVKLVSGPGCPVCVTAQRDIDCVVELALSGVKVATYGDMMRVPGSRMSLGGARAEGACVEVVCSVVDALRMCKDGEDVVFFGVGFETTAPMSAVALSKGLCVYSVHKTMPAA
ncbi:MAG: hydrogenase formation protein HypD, partial [Candidatus Aenigmarchaeota archaeon]|nr:hydrogenase formation protein HypD [Candidatus Aenigmarchaeota archaeon]